MRLVDAVRDASLLPLSPALAEWAGHQAAATGRPHVVLRRQRPYFLMGPGDRGLPRPEDAVLWAEGRGIPVFRRIGGGSLVYLDEGCLSFASAIASRDITRVDENFRALAAPVFAALARLGVEARFGAARGSYCEGPWDIVASGRKVAGVSQAVRSGFALVSGMLLVDQDPGAATDLVNTFYRKAGHPAAFRAEATTSLCRLTGEALTVPLVADLLRDALGGPPGTSLTGQERERAARLLDARRVRA